MGNVFKNKQRIFNTFFLLQKLSLVLKAKDLNLQNILQKFFLPKISKQNVIFLFLIGCTSPHTSVGNIGLGEFSPVTHFHNLSFL